MKRFHCSNCDTFRISIEQGRAKVQNIGVAKLSMAGPIDLKRSQNYWDGSCHPCHPREYAPVEHSGKNRKNFYILVSERPQAYIG